MGLDRSDLNPESGSTLLTLKRDSTIRRFRLLASRLGGRLASQSRAAASARLLATLAPDIFTSNIMPPCCEMQHSTIPQRAPRLVWRAAALISRKARASAAWSQRGVTTRSRRARTHVGLHLPVPDRC